MFVEQTLIPKGEGSCESLIPLVIRRCKQHFCLPQPALWKISPGHNVFIRQEIILKVTWEIKRQKFSCGDFITMMSPQGVRKSLTSLKERIH